MHKIRIEFFRHHRIYRVGTEHSFEEWPEETRENEIEDLRRLGFLEQPEEEPDLLALLSHDHVSGGGADTTDTD